MLTKTGRNEYQTEDGFPALPLWIDRPDRNGSRFIHWIGDEGYDIGCNRFTLSIVISVSKQYGTIIFDYRDWFDETWERTKAMYAQIGRERLARLREDTNALIRKEWNKMDEWPWRGPHPQEERMLDSMLPQVVLHDWMTQGF